MVAEWDYFWVGCVLFYCVLLSVCAGELDMMLITEWR